VYRDAIKTKTCRKGAKAQRRKDAKKTEQRGIPLCLCVFAAKNPARRTNAARKRPRPL
jgi:hypothetical protein